MQKALPSAFCAMVGRMRISGAWQWAFGILAAALIGITGYYAYFSRTVENGTTVQSVVSATGTPHTSGGGSSTAQTGPAAPRITNSFPINGADTIQSWMFTGAYTGNAALTARANTDSARLAALLGTGQYDDYDLYLGMGNDSNLLGNGRGAYQHYSRSIAVNPNKGVAYANLAHLMDELGAYHTAADAYARAVAAEPSVLEYHIERLHFLTQRFPADTARIVAALADASRVFGDTAPILTIEGTWLKSQQRYANALKAFETAKALSPGQDTPGIDAEIARLKALQ